MAGPQALGRASEIAQVIERTFTQAGLVATVIKEGDTIFVSGIPSNLRAGTNTPRTITYAVTETPTSLSVLGPSSAYQEPGRLLHAMALNVEEDLAVRDIDPSLRLGQNTKFEYASR